MAITMLEQAALYGLDVAMRLRTHRREDEAEEADDLDDEVAEEARGHERSWCLWPLACPPPPW